MLKASSTYLFSNLLNKAVPFFLLPVLTRYLAPDEYGLIAIVQILITLFLSLFGGLHSNIPRTFFSMDSQRFASYLGAVFIVLLCFFAAASLLAIGYAVLGLPLFGLPRLWLLAMPVIACMSMANLLNLTLLRTRERPTQFAAWEISHTLLNMGLSLVLVVGLQAGWQGRVVGITLPLCLYGLLGLWMLSRQGMSPLRFRWADVRETLAVSVPLIPHTLAAAAILSVDRFMIEHYLGAGAVGVYTVGFQFGMVVMLFSDAFLKAWQPWFFQQLAGDTREAKLRVVRNTWIFLGVFLSGAFLYSVIARVLLPTVVDSRYQGADVVILPVAVSFMVYGAYQIMFPYLVHTRKTKVLAVTTPAAAVINIVLNLLWIPRFGIVGAAYATIAAYAVSVSLVFLFANRYYPMPWWTTVQRAK